MTDLPDLVTARPQTVADAVDLSVRLDALAGWAADRKQAVRSWLLDRATVRREEDGAAPTWRLSAGSVSLTDPQPTPRITDAAEFAGWYEEAGGTVERRRVASVDNVSLLTFVDRLDARNEGVTLAAAEALLDAVVVTEDVLLPEGVLDGLLDGTDLPLPDGRPRVVDVPPHLVDVTSGLTIPGVTVRPAADPTVQVRPTADLRRQVRAELDSLLGPAALDR